MPRRKFAAWVHQPQSRLALIGASGWVGMALVDQALAAGIPPDRMRLFTTTPGLLNIGGAELRTEALTDQTRLGAGDWLVAHAAVIGADRVEGGDLTEVRQRNDALMHRVLGMAEGAEIRRLVMISSGAGSQTFTNNPAKTAYSRMKREHEDGVTGWAAKAGTRVLLPRVFNLGGPYINHVRNYALGDFILSLAKTDQIAIGATHPVVRSYVHVLELAAVLLELAVDKAESQAPFDIGGAETVELGELASLVAAELGITNPVIQRPPPGGDPGDRYVGDGRRYQAALTEMGRAPIPLSQIVADTIAFLRRDGAIS